MDSKQKWIEKGYEHFALYGPSQLSINKMAKELEQTRTNFYYYFNDLNELFIEVIKMHNNFHKEFVKRGKKECKKYKPDVFKLLADFPIGMLFHKQLFNNRNKPIYNYTYMSCNDISDDAFAVDLFSEYYNLNIDKPILKNIHRSLTDAWWARLNVNDLSVNTMTKITDDIMESFLVLFEKTILPSQ